MRDAHYALSLKMKRYRQITAYCLLLPAFCLLFSMTVSSQEIPSESLRLPEVVITGIDQSIIQRPISKVVPQLPLPVVTQSSRDRSDKLVREGERLSLTQPRQAEKRYLQAVALDPTNSRAYLRLGDVYRALSRYDNAAEAYQKALDASTKLLEAHYKLGILYESPLGDTQKAIEHYQTYLQLGGADQRVKIWLKNLEPR